jgi:hypothetical protein
MEYPSDFPERLQPRVDTAIADAEITFSDTRKGGLSGGHLDVAMEAYIFKVFPVFAHQACEAVREGVWTGQRLRTAIEDFLSDLIRHVYWDKNPKSTSGLFESFESRTTLNIKASDIWRDLQNNVKAAIAGNPQPPGYVPTPEENSDAIVPPNPFHLWETNRGLPNETACMRLYKACKQFQEMAKGIVSNKQLWRIVERSIAPGQILSHGEPNPEAMRVELARLMRWFLGEISETWIDHIIQRVGLRGPEAIESFKKRSHEFTDQACLHNWEWGLGQLPVTSVDAGRRSMDEAVWRDLSEGIRARKVEELQKLWLPEKSSQPTALIKEKQDRQQLKKSYLEAFRPVMLLDICWAARQHYSEWKRWLRYAVKDDSAPDRAFRSILTSGKSPSEYRKEPRPDGWK